MDSRSITALLVRASGEGEMSTILLGVPMCQCDNVLHVVLGISASHYEGITGIRISV